MFNNFIFLLQCRSSDENRQHRIESVGFVFIMLNCFIPLLQDCSFSSLFCPIVPTPAAVGWVAGEEL